MAPVMRRERNQRPTMGAKIREMYFVPNCCIMNYLISINVRRGGYQYNKDGDRDRDDRVIQTWSRDSNAYGQIKI